MEKNIYEMLTEKYEDRGWDIENKNKETVAKPAEISPLPLSVEEYQTFAVLLGNLALRDENKELCKLYFDIQRRADYGNHYPRVDAMKEKELLIWDLGTTHRPTENNAKKI